MPATNTLRPTVHRRLVRALIPGFLRRRLRAWVGRWRRRGVARREASRSEHLRAARELRRAGDIRNALVHYEVLLAEAPGDARMWGEVASAYNRLKDRERAMGAYTRALELGGPDPRYYAGLGMVQCSADRHEDAVASFRRAAELRPLTAREQKSRFKSLWTLGRFREGASLLEPAWEAVDGSRDAREFVAIGAALMLPFGDDHQLRRWIRRIVEVFDGDVYAIKRALLEQLGTDALMTRFLQAAHAAEAGAHTEALVEVASAFRRLHERRRQAFGHGYAVPGRVLQVARSPAIDYLHSNWDTADLDENFDEELMLAAGEFGYLDWPSRLGPLVRGRRVLDVGASNGIHGIGFVVSGAVRYVGVDVRLDLDSRRCRDKGPSPDTYRDFPASPRDIMRRMPRIGLVEGSITDLRIEERFDVAVLHNVTEHLDDCEAAFSRIHGLLASGGLVVFHHHNFFGWDGHHRQPKRVSDIDPADTDQARHLDWAHLDLPAEELARRGLNRIRIDDLRAVTERHFEVVTWQEMLPAVEKGLGRLTPEVEVLHPDLDLFDLSVKNVQCVARRRNGEA